jgi:hypothetical protein
VDADALFNRGNAFNVKGDLAGAVRDLDQSLAIDATKPQRFMARGLAHNHLGGIRPRAERTHRARVAPVTRASQHRDVVQLRFLADSGLIPYSEVFDA